MKVLVCIFCYFYHIFKILNFCSYIYFFQKGAPVGELIAVLGKSVTLERLNLVLGRLSEDSEQINKL